MPVPAWRWWISFWAQLNSAAARIHRLRPAFGPAPPSFCVDAAVPSSAGGGRRRPPRRVRHDGTLFETGSDEDGDGRCTAVNLVVTTGAPDRASRHADSITTKVSAASPERRKKTSTMVLSPR